MTRRIIDLGSMTENQNLIDLHKYAMLYYDKNYKFSQYGGIRLPVGGFTARLEYPSGLFYVFYNDLYPDIIPRIYFSLTKPV